MPAKRRLIHERKSRLLGKLQHEVPIVVDIERVVVTHAGRKQPAPEEECGMMDVRLFVKRQTVPRMPDRKDQSPRLVHLKSAVAGPNLRLRDQFRCQPGQMPREKLIVMVEKGNEISTARVKPGIGCARPRQAFLRSDEPELERVL